MLFIFWELFVNAMELFLFFFYANKILPFKARWQNHAARLTPILFLFIEFLIITLLNYLQASPSLTSLLSLLLDISFFIIFCQASWPLRLFWGALYSAICIISDFLIVTSTQFFLTTPLEELLYQASMMRIVLTSLYLMLIAVLVFLITYHKTDQIYYLPHQRLFFIIICIIGISVVEFLLSITIQSSQYDIPELTDQLAIFNTIFIILFLLLLFYIYSLGRSRYQIMQLTEQNTILSLEEKQYHNLLETTQTLRIMKHDLEHHLNAIQFYSDQHKYQEMRNYIQNYQSELSKNYQFPVTGSSVLDCLIAFAFQKAALYDIKFTYSVFLPKEFHMQELQFNILMGNILDNALDACQKKKKQDPDATAEIDLSIKPYQNMLIIHMENTSDGTYHTDSDHNLLSTKKEAPFLHGIGMKRIQSIVEKEHGVLTITPSENRFIIHILLPISSCNEVPL